MKQEKDKNTTSVENYVDKDNISPIHSIYCYKDQETKELVWSLKTETEFFNKNTKAKELLENIYKYIIFIVKKYNIRELNILHPPSRSYWNSTKKFDHMNKLIKNLLRFHIKSIKLNNCDYNLKISHIPHGIVPNVNKSPQKSLNRIERIKQSKDAYTLSYYFKYILKNWTKVLTNEDKNRALILIIDDIKTTGVTLTECADTIKKFSKLYSREVEIVLLAIANEP